MHKILFTQKPEYTVQKFNLQEICVWNVKIFPATVNTITPPHLQAIQLFIEEINLNK